MKRAAVIVLWRPEPGAPDGVEVYLARRTEELAFFGGYFAFPGGRAEEADTDLPLGAHDAELADDARDAAEIRGAAARELYEETGVLLARRRGEASFEAGGPRLAVDPAELRSFRVACHERDRGVTPEAFRELLDRHDLEVDTDALRPLARLRTPPFSRIRYDSSWFLVRAASEPEILPGELLEGRWLSPRAALEAWSRKAMRIAAPGLSVIEVMAAHAFEDAVREVRSWAEDFEGSGATILWQPGYEVLPLTSAPLPPSLPTTTYFVGERRFIVVDAGPRDAEPREHLVEAIARRVERGDELAALVLTHHHPDHVGALDAIVERFRPPLWMHPRTAKRLDRTPDRALEDGDTIELGAAPDGTPAWSLDVLWTPGHAEGHIVLHDPHHGAAIVGDLVSTLVSMYVGAPGGSVREYLRSVERIRALGLDSVLPSHGAPTNEVDALLARTIEHRHRRIEEVATLLDREGAPLSPDEVAQRIYGRPEPHTAQMLRRAARASLRWLVEEGRADEVASDRFCAAGDSAASP